MSRGDAAMKWIVEQRCIEGQDVEALLERFGPRSGRIRASPAAVPAAAPIIDCISATYALPFRGDALDQIALRAGAIDGASSFRPLFQAGLPRRVRVKPGGLTPEFFQPSQ